MIMNIERVFLFPLSLDIYSPLEHDFTMVAQYRSGMRLQASQYLLAAIVLLQDAGT